MLPFELTKDTPYLALSGELWSVFYEYFNRNWSCYKGFLLYLGGNQYAMCLIMTTSIEGGVICDICGPTLVTAHPTTTTNAGILLFRPLRTNFNEILIEFPTFSLKKMHLKMSSAKWRQFYLGFNVLIWHWHLPRYLSNIKLIGKVFLGLETCVGNHCIAGRIEVEGGAQ